MSDSGIEMEASKMIKTQKVSHRFAGMLRTGAPLLSYGQLVLRPVARSEQGDAGRHARQPTGKQLLEDFG